MHPLAVGFTNCPNFDLVAWDLAGGVFVEPESKTLGPWGRGKEGVRKAQQVQAPLQFSREKRGECNVLIYFGVATTRRGRRGVEPAGRSV